MIGQMILIKEDFLPINAWPLGRILEVYHGSDGKIRSEEPQINAAPTPVRVLASPHTLFNPEQSYVIIGGLGGFGLELSQWMVERGAQHILLTSRSGIRTGYQKLCMNRWKKQGVNIIVSTENTVNMNEAKLLLQKATSIKPVGGIFNLALLCCVKFINHSLSLLHFIFKILRDAFIENQTVRNFEEVCAPKVTSTANLDALSRDLCPHLQWFVCFSSVSCGRGNAGQTNYGYANSIMERICEQRTSQGLPGLAIQWGPIGDVGVLQDTVGSDVVLRGTISQSIRSCLSVLDKFLQQKHPVVLSCVPYLQEEISSSKTSKYSILSAVGKIFGLACNLVLVGFSYGECQVPISTKRTSLNDTVSEVQDCSFRRGGIILGFRTDLDVQIDWDVILKQPVCLFRGAICVYGGQCPFSPCKHSKRMPSIRGLEWDWPAFSWDLNSGGGRRLGDRQLPPICLPELRRALLDEWCNIPEDQIDNLIFSMSRHYVDCIASSGNHTMH
ncbi:fatty acid synthase [Trichonephila clavipes]|nr:fatty acid synthase [Trichonephila clavipes]